MCRVCAFLIALFIVLGFSLLLFLSSHQSLVDLTVEAASLTRFDADPTVGVLYFNLSADMCVHNPNNEDIYSNYIASALYYNLYNLTDIRVAPPMIYLHRNEIKIVTASFAGRVSYDNEFDSATGNSYNFDLWISYYFGPNSTKWYSSGLQTKLHCELDLKVVANENMKTRIWGDSCVAVSPKYWPPYLPFD